jgi:hypothetical protein
MTRPAVTWTDVVIGGHTHIADADAVARDLHARLHPNAEFMEAILTGRRDLLIDRSQ